MPSADVSQLDPRFDLVLERVIDAPRHLVWTALTDQEHVKKWWTPRPWQTVKCSIDLRPGGAFEFVMRSPEGQEFPYIACYLEVVPGERVVWTTALLPAFRPAPVPGEGSVPSFTAVIALADLGGRTGYTATAMHRDETGRAAHDAMGFQEGWGTVFNQLVETVQAIRGH